MGIVKEEQTPRDPPSVAAEPINVFREERLRNV